MSRILGSGAAAARELRWYSRVGRELHGLEVEVEVADDGVVELLGAGPVKAHVVVHGR
jgi:hypothetical protein